MGCIALLLGVAVFWSQGAPTHGSPSLLIACLAACAVEAMGVRLPHYGTVAFGLVITAPILATLGGSAAFAIALIALILRELLAFSSLQRLADELLLDLLPLSLACLTPSLMRPDDPSWLLWPAFTLTFISVRHLSVQALRSTLPKEEAETVKRLQAATANLRWGVLSLALLAIPLAQSRPVLLLALLPVLYSLRKSAIHAYAYLDHEDKKSLRKTLRGAESQVEELARSLQVTEVQRNLLVSLSKDTARCVSLQDLLVVVEKKAAGLKLGRQVELLLQEGSGWLHVRVEQGRARSTPVDPNSLDPGFKECWRNGTALGRNSARDFYPLPGIGVLSLSAVERPDATSRQVMSLFCSQVSLACLSAHRFEVLEGTLAQLAAANQDLAVGNSSLKEAMEKLQASEAKLIEGAKLAAIGQLSAGLAHEINNPLGSIRLGIEATMRKETLSPLSKDLLDKALKGVKRAESITGSLLTYSRSGNKGQVAVSPWDVLFDTCSFLSGALKVKNVSVLLPERGAEFKVVANPQELQQILTNLILNAKDAVESREAAKVQIAAGPDKDGGAFLVEVHDNGPGIAPEVRAKIFDPFFTTKPVGKGTGLGLSVSREMATAQGGRLEAGPSVLLGGACFRLTLPAPKERPGRA